MTHYQVKSGSKLVLKDFDPDETGHYKNTDQEKDKAKEEQHNSSRDWMDYRSACMPMPPGPCSSYCKDGYSGKDGRFDT